VRTLKIERGSSGRQPVEKSLWKRLWNCCKTDCGMVVVMITNTDCGVVVVMITNII